VPVIFHGVFGTKFIYIRTFEMLSKSGKIPFVNINSTKYNMILAGMAINIGGILSLTGDILCLAILVQKQLRWKTVILG